MASLLSILRTETPITSGRKERAASRAVVTAFFAKQRSRNSTQWPAASRADATQAGPLGTTGYGCRSRFVLTRSTRAPAPFATNVRELFTSPKYSHCAGEK